MRTHNFDNTAPWEEKQRSRDEQIAFLLLNLLFQIWTAREGLGEKMQDSGHIIKCE